jgi:spore germination protein GerM
MRGLAAVSVGAVLLCSPACRGGTTQVPEVPAEAAKAPAAPSEGSAKAPEAEPEPLGRATVTLYFPSATSELLAGEPREIFATPLPADRAKQILSDLISGPTTEAALPALPAGTRLRQVYVLEDGTAYADFSTELIAGGGGGSDDEIQAVYAIVNSVALNVPEIVRVGILVEGRPCETLSGHLDLRRPLRADPTLLEPPPGETEPPKEGEPTPSPAPGDKPIEV